MRTRKSSLLPSQSLFLLSCAAGLAGAVLAGCASTGAAAKPRDPIYKDCLFRQTVDDWSPLDQEHLIIFGPGRQDAFLARIAFPNPDLTFNIAVAIVDDDRNGMICGGATDGLVFGPRSAVPGKNNLVSMQKIDKATADHLLSLTKDKDALRAAIAAVQGEPSAIAPAPVVN
jgi:hypothetical protein